MKILDLKAIGKLAQKHGVPFAVDNSLCTFASQRPLELGADFSVFSTTKFVSGHGSVTAGAIVAKDARWIKKLRYVSNAEGRAQSPFDAYLVTLGLPTLIYRMKAQEKSALQIAEFLKGLPTHPQHELAHSQMDIFPGVITVNMTSESKAEQLIRQTHLFGEKASFGSADSRMEIPSKMSHASFSVKDLEAIGLTKSTVRIAVGLENTGDLIDDIMQALR